MIVLCNIPIESFAGNCFPRLANLDHDAPARNAYFFYYTHSINQGGRCNQTVESLQQADDALLLEPQTPQITAVIRWGLVLELLPPDVKTI